MQERIQGRAADSGQIRPHLRAFAVEFVADKAGSLRHLVAGVQIDRAAQHQLAFRGDQLQLVRVRFAKSADGFGRALAHGIVLRLKQRANDRRRDF